VHFFKSHIFGIILGIILAVPTIALGGSFVTSLIQGKTPSEAVTIISEQLDSLFGRVSEIESKQEALDSRLDQLEGKGISTTTPNETTSEPTSPLILQSFTPDTETQEICRQAEGLTSTATKSLIGDIKTLCTKVIAGKYESREQFDERARSLKSKWELWLTTQKAQSRN